MSLLKYSQNTSQQSCRRDNEINLCELPRTSEPLCGVSPVDEPVLLWLATTGYITLMVTAISFGVRRVAASGPSDPARIFDWLVLRKRGVSPFSSSANSEIKQRFHFSSTYRYCL